MDLVQAVEIQINLGRILGVSDKDRTFGVSSA